MACGVWMLKKSLECRGSRERPPFLCVRFIALDVCASAVQLRWIVGVDFVGATRCEMCGANTLLSRLQAYLASHDCTASYTG